MYAIIIYKQISEDGTEKYLKCNFSDDDFSYTVLLNAMQHYRGVLKSQDDDNKDNKERLIPSIIIRKTPYRLEEVIDYRADILIEKLEKGLLHKVKLLK